MTQTVIIGGGLSGLVAAFRLKQQGVTVRVLEQAPIAGGVIRSERIEDFLLEWGPNSFRNTDELVDLIHALELEPEVLAADPRATRFIFQRGELKPVPMGPGALLTTSLLSVKGKLRLLAEPFIKPGTAEDESVTDFVTRRLGAEIHDVFLAPLISGIYAGEPRELSLPAAFPKLAELEAEGGSLFRGALKAMKRAKAERARTGQPRRKLTLISFREGLGQLPQALAASLSPALETECRPISLKLNDGAAAHRFEINYERGGVNQSIKADSVIIATPAFTAAKLVRSLDAGTAAALEAIPYPPVVVVCVAYAKSQIPGSLAGFGFLVPRGEGVRMLGCIWSSSLFPGRAPSDHHLLTIFLGGTTDPGLNDLSDGEITALVTEELRRTLGATAEPRLLQLIRHRRAIPQYTLGHRARVAEIEAISQTLPGLFLAGNYLHGVAGGDCVAQANRVAAQTAEYLTQLPVQSQLS